MTLRLRRPSVAATRSATVIALFNAAVAVAGLAAVSSQHVVGWPVVVMFVLAVVGGSQLVQAHTLVTPRAAPLPRTPDDDRQAVDGLFDLLDEFLAEFPEGRSRRRLFHEYFLWKEHVGLVDLDLERFRPRCPLRLASRLAGVPRTCAR